MNEKQLGIDPICKIKSKSNDQTNHVLRLVNDFEDIYERARNVMEQRVERAADRLSA